MIETSGLGEEMKYAFAKLSELDSFAPIWLADGDIQIILEDTPAFRSVVTLINTDSVPQDKSGYYCLNLDLTFLEDQRRFRFSGELEEPVYGTLHSFAFTFERADLKIELYNACKTTWFFIDPWDFLQRICVLIDMKAELPGDNINAEERELLPLIREITALDYHGAEFPDRDRYSFGELKKLAGIYGCRRAVTLLSALESINPAKNKYKRTVKKLSAVLCRVECEPLWREIYGRICDSQTGYPDKTDSLCDKELLAEARSKIQALMESRGYTGSYPDFVKNGSVNGVRLIALYQTYFAGKEKRAQYHIHCMESGLKNGFDNPAYAFEIKFICGTAFLKKDEPDTDVFDCLFKADGKRQSYTVYHYGWSDDTESSETDELAADVALAIKKAEGLKLTKEERKRFYNTTLAGWGLFWRIFLFVGGIFGIVMTLGMALIGVVTAVIAGSFSKIPEIIRDFPWLLCLAFSWILSGGLFGGLFGLLSLFSRRR